MLNMLRQVRVRIRLNYPGLNGWNTSIFPTVKERQCGSVEVIFGRSSHGKHLKVWKQLPFLWGLLQPSTRVIIFTSPTYIVTLKHTVIVVVFFSPVLECKLHYYGLFVFLCAYTAWHKAYCIVHAEYLSHWYFLFTNLLGHLCAFSHI